MNNMRHGNSSWSDRASAQWLSLFFCLPQERFRGHPEYMGLPRNPHVLISLSSHDPVLSSEHFILFIEKAYAEAVWKHIQIPKKGGHVRMDSPMSDFCKNFALWQLVYSAVDHVRTILEEQL